jgi:hypothetical protein
VSQYPSPEYPPPNWRYWGIVPTVSLFEAVALSLNIEPRFFEAHPAHVPSTMSLIIALVQPPAFHERLDLARRCIGETLSAANARGGEEHVRISDFVKWATGLGWDLPPELLELAQAKNRRSASATVQTTYSTGLAGKPTSWHLIEPECRRRYNAGERHPTRAEWARTLASWLGSEHPSAAVTKPKTLTNRLSGLLRELEAQPNGAQPRPK